MRKGEIEREREREREGSFAEQGGEEKGEEGGRRLPVAPATGVAPGRARQSRVETPTAPAAPWPGECGGGAPATSRGRWVRPPADLEREQERERGERGFERKRK